MTFSFKFNFGKDGKLFRENWWPATREQWLPMLLADNKKYWASQTTTQGVPWKPLTRKYKIWKSANFGDTPILRLTGKMQDTAEIRSWGDRIFVRSSELGPYHQFGTRRMVARPWMGVPDMSLERIPGLAWKHILIK